MREAVWRWFLEKCAGTVMYVLLSLLALHEDIQHLPLTKESFWPRNKIWKISRNISLTKIDFLWICAIFTVILSSLTGILNNPTLSVSNVPEKGVIRAIRFYTGRLHPEVQPRTPSHPTFDRNVAPFVHLVQTNATHLSQLYPSLFTRSLSLKTGTLLVGTSTHKPWKGVLTGRKWGGGGGG